MDVEIKLINDGCNPIGNIVKANLSDEEILGPKDSILIPLGFSIINKNVDYKVIILPTDSMVNKEIEVVGVTEAPDDMNKELGVVLFNYGKRAWYIKEYDIVGDIVIIENNNFIIKD